MTSKTFLINTSAERSFIIFASPTISNFKVNIFIFLSQSSRELFSTARQDGGVEFGVVDGSEPEFAQTYIYCPFHKP